MPNKMKDYESKNIQDITYSDIPFLSLVNSNIRGKIQLQHNICYYVNYQPEQNNNYFGKVDQTIFDYPDIDSKTIGLYVWLVTHANKFDSTNTIEIKSLSISTIIMNLKGEVRRSSRIKLEESLKWLEKKQLIIRKNTFVYKNDQYFNVYIPSNISRFCKVYLYSVDKIISNAKSISSLTKLGTYAAVRSRIFERDNDCYGWVCNYGEHYLANQSKLSIKTYQNNIKWLCDNEIFAYFIGTKAPDKDGNIGRKKRFMSEMKDHCLLAGDMMGQILNGQLTWVSLNNSDEYVDTELDKAEGE